MNDPSPVLSITRPHPSLLWLYVIRCLIFPPAIIPCLFKYMTLKYRFDNEGVLTSWGLLWKAETYLTYARVQDIHLSRGLLERWFGLATIQIQTAAGSANAEMSLVGIDQFDAVRDFLYSKMRGARFGERDKSAAPAPSPAAVAGDDAAVLLAEIRDELRAVRAKLEARP